MSSFAAIFIRRKSSKIKALTPAVKLGAIVIRNLLEEIKKELNQQKEEKPKKVQKEEKNKKKNLLFWNIN